MGYIQKAVRINAPPQRVWAVLCDATRLPEWNDDLVAVKDVRGPLGPAQATPR